MQADRLGDRGAGLCRGPDAQFPAVDRPARALPRRPEGEGMRVDTGVYEGAEISIYYDPMIAKLVAYGARPRRGDRPAARGARRLLHPPASAQYRLSSPRSRRSERFAEGRAVDRFHRRGVPGGFAGAEIAAPPGPGPARRGRGRTQAPRGRARVPHQRPARRPRGAAAPRNWSSCSATAAPVSACALRTSGYDVESRRARSRPWRLDLAARGSHCFICSIDGASATVQIERQRASASG